MRQFETTTSPVSAVPHKVPSLLPLALSLLLVQFSCSAQAQASSSTTPATRSLSLRDSIQLALEHNLNLQIERYSPQIALFALESSYAYFDPVFEMNGGENFNRVPSGFNPRYHLEGEPTETQRDVFRSGLSGRGTAGLKYDFSAGLSSINGTYPPFFERRLNQFVTLQNPQEYATDVRLTIDQPLLKDFWTDADRTQIKINKRNLKISQLGFKAQLMDTVKRVQDAYYDLVLARELVAVQEDALALVTHLLQEERDRLQIGVTTPLDEKQAESQIAVAHTDLLSAQNQATIAEDGLKNLLTDDFAQWQAVSFQPSERPLALPEAFDLFASWRDALELRPDFNQMKEEVEKQNIILKFRRNQMFPSLDLVASAGLSGLATNLSGSAESLKNADNPNWSAGAVFRIPLTLRAERNNYKAAKASQQQALLRLKRLEQDIMVQVNGLVKIAQRNFDRIDSARQARQFAAAALEAEQIKLANGRSTSFVVLELQNKLTRARSTEIQSLTEYNKALADLHFAEGTILERAHVELNVE